MTNVPAIGGQNTSSGRQRTETFGKGRRCADPECGAILSEYNPGVSCTSHPISVVRPTGPSKGAQRQLEILLSS